MKGENDAPGKAIACPECDLLQRIPSLPVGGRARCGRCGETLAIRHRDPIDLPLALTIAAAILLVIANTTPLMSLDAVGRHASTTVVGGAYQMWLDGSELTALSVLFCAVVAPGAHVGFLLIVLLAARRPPAPRWVGEMLRIAHAAQAWSMTEVMLLGILVALVKISELADVVPGVGMFAAGMFVVLIAAVEARLDVHEIWERVEWADDPRLPLPHANGVAP
jgi:paraquat-inducible protein A